jgi:hypothetical protein
MPLATGKPALKQALLQLSANTDPDKTPDQAIDEFINALETFIKTADVSPTSLTPLTNSGGPVTGLGSLL